MRSQLRTDAAVGTNVPERFVLALALLFALPAYAYATDDPLEASALLVAESSAAADAVTAGADPPNDPVAPRMEVEGKPAGDETAKERTDTGKARETGNDAAYRPELVEEATGK